MSKPMTPLMLDLIRAVQDGRTFAQSKDRFFIKAGGVSADWFEEVARWFTTLPSQVVAATGLEHSHDELDNMLDFEVTPQILSAAQQGWVDEFVFPDDNANRIVRVDPRAAWIEDLLTRTEGPHPDDEIRTLHRLVEAFEDACPDFQGAAGQDLIAQSEDADFGVEIDRLRRGLTAIALTTTPEQRADVDGSIAVQVMDAVAEAIGPRR